MRHTRLRAGLALVAASTTLLLFAAQAHAAQGVGLAWNHCQGEAGAASNALFACDTNAGEHVLYGTFTLDTGISLGAVDSRLDVVAASAVLPLWWQFGYIAACRRTSMIARMEPDPTATTCVDWTNGFSQFGASALFCSSAVSCGASQPANTARILIGVAMPQFAPIDLAANQSWFTFALHIDNTKTVGAGVCAGCITPVCIRFSQATLTSSDATEHRFLTVPSIPGGDVITWQSGAPGAASCFAATPTRLSTWGSVKALYR